MCLSTSNKGWHSLWFYVKDDVATPLPVFSGRIIEEVLGSWKWGVPDKDKKRIKDHLAALQILKERGVKGSGIIGAYHTRRVTPLISRALPLYLMVPGASLEGTVLVNEALPLSEVVQRIKEAMEPLKDNAGVVLRRLHRLLDALRHFGGGSASSTSAVPSSDAPGAIRYRGSARLIIGATLCVW